MLFSDLIHTTQRDQNPKIFFEVIWTFRLLNFVKFSDFFMLKILQNLVTFRTAIVKVIAVKKKAKANKRKFHFLYHIFSSSINIMLY